MDVGFSIIKKKIGETEWGIGWLPLGGYVKLSGMIDESMDTEQLKQEPQPWEFRSKPAWQRLIIMLGGIIVNILLALLIFTTLYSTVGQKYISTEVVQKNGLAFGEVGKSVGFRNGDKIVAVDGNPVNVKFNRLTIDVLLSNKITLERDGKKVDMSLTDENIGKILGMEGKSFMSPRTTFSVDSISADSDAKKAGLLKGDKIVAVDGIKVRYFDELNSLLNNRANDSIELKIDRNSTEVVVKTKLNKDSKIGFMPKIALIDEEFEVVNKLSLGESVSAAAKESWQLLVYNVKQFKLILKPKTGAYKQVKSPIGIARMLPETWDWEFVWGFTALFSIALAFMNLLPIPGLDGGHALFTIAEMVTGKTLSEKAMGYVQTGGMIFLLSLMALTFGKDIYQWVAETLLAK